MGSTRSFAVAVAASMMLLPLGCASPSSDDAPADPSAENDITESYVDPGTRLDKATHIYADVVDDAAFIVFDRALRRATPDGNVTDLMKVDAGFEDLVVSKTRLAFLTSSIVNNSYKVLLHVLSRADGWKEVFTQDFSEAHAPYKHPIRFLDDDTLAVGNGDEIDVFAKDGTKTTVGGASSAMAGHEMWHSYGAGDAGHLYALLDNGDMYLVDVAKNALTLQPKLEGVTNQNGPLWKTFEPKSKTWITTDFEGVKVYGTDGKLLRKADLVTAKNRYIAQAAVLDSDTLLVANLSEKSQERHVLATYALRDLTRKELGTLDGMVGELAPAKGGRLYYTFSPKGAAGFDSHVFYGYARTLSTSTQ